MSGKSVTLLAILVFVALVVGSFVWFIVSWDPATEEPVTGIGTAQEVAA
ncbi:hypothetical protein [Roseovarius aestuariivivens]|nr:hypothetical protein [Roseovarius aestuariivivens]